MRSAQRCVFAVLVTLGTTALSWGQFRTPEWQSFHNNTFVGSEPEVVRQALFDADEQLGAGRPEEAGRLLLRLLRSDPEVRVRSGERLVVPLSTAVALRLRALPDDVLESLRRSEADEAQRAWSDRVGVDDVATLRRIELSFPLNEASERARYQLAQLDLLAGRPEAAAARFEQLVAWPSVGPGRFRAEAEARLRECLALTGRVRSESPLLAPLTGRVLQAGVAVDLDAVRPPAADASAPTTRLSDPARAERPHHDGVLAAGRARAASLVATRRSPRDAPHRERFQIRGRDEEVLPTGLPLVWGSDCLTLEGDGIHVRDAATGADRLPAVRYDFDLHLDPRRFEVVPDRSSLAIHGDQLLAALHLRDRDAYPERQVGALFLLDLARDAYVSAAHLPHEDGAEDEVGRLFVGPAVFSAGRWCLPSVRLVEDDTECELWAFDERLQPAQSLFLARSRAVARYADRFSSEQEKRLVSCTPPSQRNGVLYVGTNLGVVAAVRAADFGLEWLFRYNRLVPVDSRRYTQEVFYVTGGWPSRDVMVLPDRLLVGPSDSRYLYVLGRWPSPDGDLVLTDPVEKESRLAWIGADDQRLYFLVRTLAGRSDPQVAVQATDHAGGVVWQTAPLPLEQPLAGVPAQTDRYLYVPTDRLVYRVDLASEGRWDQVVPPPDAVGVPYPRHGAIGDLVATPRGLLSQSSRFLVLFPTEDEADVPR